MFNSQNLKKYLTNLDLLSFSAQAERFSRIAKIREKAFSSSREYSFFIFSQQVEGFFVEILATLLQNANIQI